MHPGAKIQPGAKTHPGANVAHEHGFKLYSLTTCSEYFYYYSDLMYYAPISSFALGSAIAPVAEWFRVLNHAMSVVSSSPTWDTCETSKVLLAGVPGGFSRGSPVFASPTV